MSNKRWPQKILLLYEGSDFGGDFDNSFVNGFEDQGCEVTCIQRGQPWSAEFDLVLGYGPFTLDEGSILPVVKQLLDLRPAQRPIFVWWLTEGTPNPHYPDWFVNTMSRLRLRADSLLENGSASRRSYWRDLALKGHRLRIFGQLVSARDQGVLDLLVITCSSRAAYYRERDFNPVVIPLGYDTVYGQDLGLERDIEVVFLGNEAAARRHKVLSGLLHELTNRGIQVNLQNHLYGAARTELLNRSLLMINILREPQDYVGQRFMLAAANKVLVISEPVVDRSPFVPGQHLVTAPLNEMADKVEFYLANDDKRQEIVDRSYRLVTKELTISKMIGRIIEHARLARESQTETANGRSL